MDNVAQLVVGPKRRALVQGSRRFDRPCFAGLPRPLIGVFRAPLAGGVEVLQAVADGVDFAVAAGALWLLLVRDESFTGGEHLVFKPAELRHVRGRWWRRVVKQFAQHPRPALDGAGVLSIATHAMDSGHPKQPSARRIRRQGDRPEIIAAHPR